jgi:hypothetical protein
VFTFLLLWSKLRERTIEKWEEWFPKGSLSLPFSVIMCHKILGGCVCVDCAESFLFAWIPYSSWLLDFSVGRRRRSFLLVSQDLLSQNSTLQSWRQTCFVQREVRNHSQCFCLLLCKTGERERTRKSGVHEIVPQLSWIYVDSVPIVFSGLFGDISGFLSPTVFSLCVSSSQIKECSRRVGRMNNVTESVILQSRCCMNVTPVLFTRHTHAFVLQRFILFLNRNWLGETWVNLLSCPIL